MFCTILLLLFWRNPFFSLLPRKKLISWNRKHGIVSVQKVEKTTPFFSFPTYFPFRAINNDSDMCSHGVASNLITSYFVMFSSIFLSLYESVALMDYCMWCMSAVHVREWASTFPFWTTDQYCSSVNIISFFRLIQLKRDELKKTKDRR